jgi:V8-like Glu-specific endopeptidase
VQLLLVVVEVVAALLVSSSATAAASAAGAAAAAATDRALDNDTTARFAGTTESDDGSNSRPIDDNDNIFNVVGGKLAKLGDYPSFAISNGLFSCGATLIWRDVLVTAASCNFGPLDVLNAVQWYIGGVASDGSDAVETATIQSLIPHPYFNDATRHDIMLVILNNVTSKSPLAVWNANATLPAVNASVTVIGYTCLRFDASLRNRPLYQTQVQISNGTVCDEAFASIDFYPNETICSADQGTGPCINSYGGPLLDPISKRVYGLVSVGATGRRPPLANVYTRLSAYTGWIQYIICQQSRVPPNGTSCANATNPFPLTPPPSSRDCFASPPPDCTAWRSWRGTRMRRQRFGACTETCSPLPRLAVMLGWRCGPCAAVAKL